jgi:hypothetical protein
MKVDIIKSIPDIELRIEMLARSLKVNFFTEPTISYFFNDEEIGELLRKGVLVRVEGYLLNKKEVLENGK